jgi:hypothetical protein
MELKEDVPKLTKEEYWEWRTTIAEMNTAREKLNGAILQHKVLQRDAELMLVRAQLYKRSAVDDAQKVSDEFRSEYDRFKAKLEARLGLSLSGKMIDDITLEVRDLPNNPEED